MLTSSNNALKRVPTRHGLSGFLNACGTVVLAALLVNVVAAAASPFGKCASAGEWATLFNGKDIEGWQQKGGEATCEIEDGIWCVVLSKAALLA